MPTFTHAYGDDPLLKATTGDIVLVSVTTGLNKQLVEILNEQGVPLKSSGTLIEGIYTAQISYELKSTSLVLALNADINAWRVSAISASCNSRGFPTVNVTAVKPAAGSFATVTGAYGSVTIAGGFGMVNLWGGACTQPLSSSLNISSSQAVALAGTSGDILTAGLAVYAFRKSCTLEGYSAVTEASGAKVTADENPITTREGFQLYRKSWTDYLINA